MFGRNSKELEAEARAFPTTGRGAHSDIIRALKTQTAAKVLKDFAEHKTAKLTARAAGADGRTTQINFRVFFEKLRVQTKADKWAKATKVLKKPVVEKL